MIGDLLQTFFTGRFIFLVIACFLASFIDAVAGGGGLISLPAYLASGLPPHVALGTNKVSSSIATTASSIKFALSGKIYWNLVKNLVPFSLIGAILGVRTILLVDSKYLYPITIVLLLLVLVNSLTNRKMGVTNDYEGLNKKNLFKGRIMALVMGFYDGFFGPGTGSFIIFMLIRIFKLDFTHASGNTKMLNLTSNLASVVMYAYFGKVNYLYSVPLGIIMIFGAILGARTAVKKGHKFIKPMFLVVTTIVLLKMVAEGMLHIDVSQKIQEFINSFIV